VLLFEYVHAGCKGKYGQLHIFPSDLPRSRTLAREGSRDAEVVLLSRTKPLLFYIGWLRKRGLTCGQSDCAVTESVDKGGDARSNVDGIIGIIRGSSFEVTHRTQPYYTRTNDARLDFARSRIPDRTKSTTKIVR